MPRAYDVFKEATTRPIEAVEAIIAGVMMVLGLYVASPWYVVSPGAAVGSGFQDSFQHVIVGFVFFILPALPVILALFWQKCNTVRLRTLGTFMMFVGLVFVSLLTILAVGWTPMTWVISTGMGLISGICYLYVKQRE